MKAVSIGIILLVIAVILLSVGGGMGKIKAKLIQDEVQKRIQEVADNYSQRDTELQEDIEKARQRAAKYEVQAMRARQEANRLKGELASLEQARAEIKPVFDVSINREWLEKRYGIRTY